MAKNLALSLRKWHKKNQIGENGGERKINPSANPENLTRIIMMANSAANQIQSLPLIYVICVVLWFYQFVADKKLRFMNNCMN